MSPKLIKFRKFQPAKGLVLPEFPDLHIPPPPVKRTSHGVPVDEIEFDINALVEVVRKHKDAGAPPREITLRMEAEFARQCGQFSWGVLYDSEAELLRSIRLMPLGAATPAAQWALKKAHMTLIDLWWKVGPPCQDPEAAQRTVIRGDGK